MSNPTVKINDWVRQQFPMAIIVLMLVFLIIQVVPLVTPKANASTNVPDATIIKDVSEKLQKIVDKNAELVTTQTVAFERLTMLIAAQTRMTEKVADRLEQMNSKIEGAQAVHRTP